MVKPISIRKTIAGMTLMVFLFNTVLPPAGYGQSLPIFPESSLTLPSPGTMMSTSVPYVPPLLKGVTVDSNNPFKFDFIVDPGDAGSENTAFKSESQKLVRYFLAALTVPDNDLWVNLSPNEKDRIIPDGFGVTQLGRDLLAQDYLLKQLTASLLYPENALGKEFWEKVYAQIGAQAGGAEIPIDTFNKVWIVPQKAVVYEHEGTAYVVESRLRVMLEEDYKSDQKKQQQTTDHKAQTTELIRSIILPAIEREVNEGKNFAELRQIYNSIILAVWYKQALKDGLLSKVYVDQNKTLGVDVKDKEVKLKIYDQYLKAFQKGVYDFVKDEYDPKTQAVISRKYFSGGADFGFKGLAGDDAMVVRKNADSEVLNRIQADIDHALLQKVSVKVTEPKEAEEFIEKRQEEKYPSDAAQLAQPASGQMAFDGYLRVTDSKDKTRLVRLTQPESLDIYELKAKLMTEYGLSSDHVAVVAMILDALKGLRPHLSLFETLVEDFWGSAFPENNGIALHQGFKDNDIAKFHQLGRFLQKLKMLDLKLAGNKIQGSVNGQRFTLQLGEEALAIAKKDESDPRYLLRALQREIFKEYDQRLTSLIFLEENRDELLTRILYPNVIRRTQRIVRTKKLKRNDLAPVNISLLLTLLSERGVLHQRNQREVVNLIGEFAYFPQSHRYLDIIEGFVKANVINDKNLSQMRELMRRIAQQSNASEILEALDNLATAVNKGEADPLVLNPPFLLRLITNKKEPGNVAILGVYNSFGKKLKGKIKEEDLPAIEELLVGKVFQRMVPVSSEKRKSVLTKQYLGLLFKFLTSGHVTADNLGSIAKFLDVMTDVEESKLPEALDFLAEFVGTPYPLGSFFDWKTLYNVVLLHSTSVKEVLAAEEFTEPMKREFIDAVKTQDVMERLALSDLLYKADTMDRVHKSYVYAVLHLFGYNRDVQDFIDATMSFPSKGMDNWINFIVTARAAKVMTNDNLKEWTAFSLEFKQKLEAEAPYRIKLLGYLDTITGLAKGVADGNFSPVIIGIPALRMVSKFPHMAAPLIDLAKAAKDNGYDLRDPVLLSIIHDENLTKEILQVLGKMMGIKRLDLSQKEEIGELVTLMKENPGFYLPLTSHRQVLPYKTQWDALVFNIPFLTAILKQIKNGANLENISLAASIMKENMILTQEFISELILVIDAVSNYQASSQGGVNTISLVEKTLMMIAEKAMEHKRSGAQSPFSPIKIVTANPPPGGEKMRGELHLYLMLEKIRVQLEGNKLNEVLAQVTEESLTGENPNELHRAAVYLDLVRNVPKAAGLIYKEFLEILQTHKSSPYLGVVLKFIKQKIYKEKTVLTDSDQKLIIEFSLALHEGVLKLVGNEKRDITFRELIRFNIDLSRYYLQAQGLENVLQIFILTAQNIYGRALKNAKEKEAFILMLNDLLNGPFKELLLVAQVDTKDLHGNLIEIIRGIVKFADYEGENLKRTVKDNEVPLKVGIQANLERARQVGRESMLVVNNNNAVFVEETINEYGEKENVVMLRISQSNFSRRQELFGMYVPIEPMSRVDVESLVLAAQPEQIKAALRAILGLKDNDVEKYYSKYLEGFQQDPILKWAIATHIRYGKEWKKFMQWEDGVLVKMSREAAKPENKDKRFVIVLDNISAAPDGLRLLLNPVLLERKVEMAERGLTLTLPDNLHFILTMHEGTEIKDESFMNRPIVQYVDDVTDTDMLRYLTSERVGVKESIAQRLVQMFHQLQNLSLELKENVHFTFYDIMAIARRIQGMSSDSRERKDEKEIQEEDIWEAEAFNYLSLMLKNKKDKELLHQKIFSQKQFKTPRIVVNRANGTIVFDGVVVTAPAELMAKAHGNSKGFPELMNDVYGYDVSELETRVLSQLVRQQKYLGGAVQIEGPSGEGKTEVGRVFAKLASLVLEESTINEDTNLANFRGQFRPTASRGIRKSQPRYLPQLAEGGHLFMENEINTNEAGGLYYWFFPEVARRAQKVLSEFPESGESIAKVERINRNNLWLFTVNPEHFQGRVKTPPMISALMPRFQMVQDLDTLPQKIEEIFISKGLKKYKKLANKLALIHRQLKEAKMKNRITSPQDITPREYRSVIDKFERYVTGMSADAAFRKAVQEVYSYMWKYLADIEGSKNILREFLGEGPEITAREALRTALEEQARGDNVRPILVFHNGANDVEKDILGDIESVDPQGKIVRVPLSFFHGRRQFIGGMMSISKEEKEKLELEGKWKRLQELYPQFKDSLGIIPNFIREARLSNQNVYTLMQNYTHMNPQASFLNEFLQTGVLDGIEEILCEEIVNELFETIKKGGGALWDRLNQEYSEGKLSKDFDQISLEDKFAFAKWFYGQAPKNLKIVATGSSAEETLLSVAELNRFLPINMAQSITKGWAQEYVESQLTDKLAGFRDLILSITQEVFGLYDQQAKTLKYQHNRLGRGDFDEFLSSLNGLDQLDEETIKKVAFYTLGIGLRPDYRDQLTFSDGLADPETAIQWEEQLDGLYVIVNGLRYKTGYQTKSEMLARFAEETKGKFLAPTTVFVRQLASMLMGIQYRRVTVIEGNPGGGKTASVQELARMVRKKATDDMMFEDVDIGGFLGRLSKKGKEFILTVLEKDAKGQFVVKFLNAYASGNFHLLDEGAIGRNSQEVISLLTELANMEEIDLGLFHPGLWGQKIKRGQGFHLFIAQNPEDSTRGREAIPYQPDILAHKIWTENVLDQKDAVRILNHHLSDQAKGILTEDQKKQIADIHIEYSKIHPQKEELSPRQLIMIADIINEAVKNGVDVEKAMFEGLTSMYLTRVSDQEFERLWNVISTVTQGRLDIFLEEWKLPIDVKKEESYVQFNGTRLPKSTSQGHVKEDDVNIIENLSSQTRSLRALAIGVSQRRPIVLLEEEGADSLDLAKKFAYLTGYDLHAMWSHTQMTRMQILSTILPQFEELMDHYGIRREYEQDMEQKLEGREVEGEKLSEGFIMSLGFLAQYLVKKGEVPKDAGVQKLLFFHLMDAIPEHQRVMLNELLNSREIDLVDERGEHVTYVIPDNVHIIASSSLEHKFSSAFINRFLPIRVNNVSAIEEIQTLVANRFPLVTREEVSWANEVARGVADYDQRRVFKHQYGFSPSDVMKLARTIHFEKQRDLEALENERKEPLPNTEKIAALKKNLSEPLYYALKAMYLTYGLAIEDNDLKKYEDDIMKKHFLSRLFPGGESKDIDEIYSQIMQRIQEELSQIEREEYVIPITWSEIGEQEKTLPNGIALKRQNGKIVIKTAGANIYEINEDQISDWISPTEKSDQLEVKKEGDKLLLKLMLIKSIGGIEIPRDDDTRSLSLPENEVHSKDFVHYTPEVIRMMAGILRSWQPVEDALGRVRYPRAVFMAGESGTAKSTLIRNLKSIFGIPEYTLNSHEDLKASDTLVGMKMKEGRFEVGVKDFFAAIGQIRQVDSQGNPLKGSEWQRISRPPQQTSNRKIILVDEANASPEILYAWAALLRGEKRFVIQYANANYEVQVDDEVYLVLTFNPAETYAGRGEFAREISSHADKYWTPNPLNYEKSVKIEILQEYHRRGIDNARKQLEAGFEEEGPLADVIELHPQEVQADIQKRHHQVEPAVVRVNKQLKKPETPELGNLIDMTERLKKKKTAEPKEAAEPQKVKQVQRIPKPDIKALKERARTFTVEASANVEARKNIYLKFADEILSDFLIALGYGFKDEELNTVVLESAARLDPELSDNVKTLIKLYSQKNSRYDDLKEAVLSLRRTLVLNGGVVIFIQPYDNGSSIFLKITPEKIQRDIKLEAEQLRALGENPDLYINRFIRALVLKGDRYPAGNKRGFYEGEFAFGFESTSERLIDAVPMSEVVNWTVWHELGHVMDAERLRVRGIKFPKGIRWTQLASMVNARFNSHGIWLTPNGELNAVLFPLIFSSHAKEYLLNVFVERITETKNPKDYYAQSAKGILNGLLKYYRETGEMTDGPEITNAFEQPLIDELVEFIDKKSAEQGRENFNRELNAVALKMYREPQKYLATAEAGAYLTQGTVTSTGGLLEEMMRGIDGIPDIENLNGDSLELETDVQTEGAQGQQTKFIRDPPSQEDQRSGKEKGKGELEHKDIDIPEGFEQQIRKLFEIDPQLVAKFVEVFAGVTKYIKITSESGDEIDIERMIYDFLEPFIRKKKIQPLASVAAGVTVDASGSTLGNLRVQFQEMANYFLSLMYYSAGRNSDIASSLSVITETFENLTEFNQTRDQKAIEGGIAQLGPYSGGGINTVALEAGLREKYQGQQNKKYRLEFVFTDGGETSALAGQPAEIKKLMTKLEKDLNLDTVFFGLNTQDVENYPRYINFTKLPTVEEFIRIMINLSLKKVKNGSLPLGDLSEEVGLVPETEKAVGADAAMMGHKEISWGTVDQALQGYWTGFKEDFKGYVEMTIQYPDPAHKIRHLGRVREADFLRWEAKIKNFITEHKDNLTSHMGYLRSLFEEFANFASVEDELNSPLTFGDYRIQFKEGVDDNWVVVTMSIPNVKNGGVATKEGVIPADYFHNFTRKIKTLIRMESDATDEEKKNIQRQIEDLYETTFKSLLTRKTDKGEIFENHYWDISRGQNPKGYLLLASRRPDGDVVVNHTDGLYVVRFEDYVRNLSTLNRFSKRAELAQTELEIMDYQNAIEKELKDMADSGVKDQNIAGDVTVADQKVDCKLAMSVINGMISELDQIINQPQVGMAKIKSKTGVLRQNVLPLMTTRANWNARVDGYEDVARMFTRELTEILSDLGIEIVPESAAYSIKNKTDYDQKNPVESYLSVRFKNRGGVDVYNYKVYLKELAKQILGYLYERKKQIKDQGKGADFRKLTAGRLSKKQSRFLHKIKTRIFLHSLQAAAVAGAVAIGSYVHDPVGTMKLRDNIAEETEFQLRGNASTALASLKMIQALDEIAKDSNNNPDRFEAREKLRIWNITGRISFVENPFFEVDRLFRSQESRNRFLTHAIQAAKILAEYDNIQAINYLYYVLTYPSSSESISLALSIIGKGYLVELDQRIESWPLEKLEAVRLELENIFFRYSVFELQSKIEKLITAKTIEKTYSIADDPNHPDSRVSREKLKNWNEDEVLRLKKGSQALVYLVKMGNIVAMGMMEEDAPDLTGGTKAFWLEERAKMINGMDQWSDQELLNAQIKLIHGRLSMQFFSSYSILSEKLMQRSLGLEIAVVSDYVNERLARLLIEDPDFVLEQKGYRDIKAVGAKATWPLVKWLVDGSKDTNTRKWSARLLGEVGEFDVVFPILQSFIGEETHEWSQKVEAIHGLGALYARQAPGSIERKIILGELLRISKSENVELNIGRAAEQTMQELTNKDVTSQDTTSVEPAVEKRITQLSDADVKRAISSLTGDDHETVINSKTYQALQSLRGKIIDHLMESVRDPGLNENAREWAMILFGESALEEELLKVLDFFQEIFRNKKGIYPNDLIFQALESFKTYCQAMSFHRSFDSDLEVQGGELINNLGESYYRKMLASFEPLLESPDEDLRKNAYGVLVDVLKEHVFTHHKRIFEWRKIKGKKVRIKTWDFDHPKDFILKLHPEVKRKDSDDAMISKDQKVGGIDLTPQRLNLQIKRDDNGVPLPVHLQNIQNIHIDGLIPIIINITPMHDLPRLLGITESPDNPPQLSQL